MNQAILIMVDTQRPDMLSCYDSSALSTANIDSIAERGIKFNKGYTCQPVCGPARSAIFTGLYPHSNGMETNSMPLRNNIKTAGDWLNAANIECGYMGKWHLDGGDYFGYGKCPSGYNPKYWYDGKNFLDDLKSDDDRMLSRKNMNTRFDDPCEEDTHAHRVCDRAIAFLDEFKNKDFFLTVSLDEPHDPYICPRRFFQKLKDNKYKFHKTANVKCKLKLKPEHQCVWAKRFKRVPFAAITKYNRAFFACNQFVDYEIGRVLDKVKALGLTPMIIYTADHGDMLLSHGLMGKGCAMYDEITRIPYIINGGAINNALADVPVSHIDILPTVMRHLGITVPKMLAGTPLQDIKHSSTRDIFMEFTRYEVDHDSFMGFQPIRCIFDGRYKLTINLMTSDELYDMLSDPYEKTNIIDSKATAKLRDAMHDRLISHMNDTRDLYRGYYWHCRDWRKDIKPSFNHTGFTRQLEEEDTCQLDYTTGLPMQDSVRKKR